MEVADENFLISIKSGSGSEPQLNKMSYWHRDRSFLIETGCFMGLALISRCHLKLSF